MRTLLVFLFTTAATLAGDWPQFLGPQRNAVADGGEAALPEVFPGDLKPLWEKPLGTGFAGPVVADGTLVICHRKGDELMTEAVSATTGEVIWKAGYATDYVDGFGFDNGPRAVPAIAGGRVFTHGPEGRVTALGLATGTTLWSYDTAAAVGSQPGYFGRAPSPLVAGGRVIIGAGGTLEGKPAGLVALDVNSGSPVWTAVDDEAGYASPVTVAEGGPVLAWMRNELWLVDAGDGRVAGSLPLRARMDASVNAATPVPCGEGRWFVSAGYGVGANLLKVTPGGKPVFEAVWAKQDVMDCHYSTPVVKDGHVYGFHGRQETGQVLRCVNVADGKVLWESPKVPGGTVILAGGRLLVVTEQGELWVVRAAPEKFEQMAAVQILRAGHRSHAAYSEGVLYARDAEKLVAIKLR